MLLNDVTIPIYLDLACLVCILLCIGMSCYTTYNWLSFLSQLEPRCLSVLVSVSWLVLSKTASLSTCQCLVMWPPSHARLFDRRRAYFGLGDISDVIPSITVEVRQLEWSAMRARRSLRGTVHDAHTMIWGKYQSCFLSIEIKQMSERAYPLLHNTTQCMNINRPKREWRFRTAASSQQPPKPPTTLHCMHPWPSLTPV